MIIPYRNGVKLLQEKCLYILKQLWQHSLNYHLVKSRIKFVYCDLIKHVDTNQCNTVPL